MLQPPHWPVRARTRAFRRVRCMSLVFQRKTILRQDLAGGHGQKNTPPEPYSPGRSSVNIINVNRFKSLMSKQNKHFGLDIIYDTFKYE